MLKKIIAVSGKPGLFRYIARGNNSLIVEALDQTKKRQTVFASQKAVALSDISIYTDDGKEKPLHIVLENIRAAYDGKAVPLHPKKAADSDITAFFQQALPDYDTDRVKLSDMRKVLQWYNLLIDAGLTQFAPEESPAETASNG